MAGRLRLLCLLCDLALGTAPFRRAVDARMDRIEASQFDWQAAAWAGFTQGKPPRELPRVEPMGYDREYALLWAPPNQQGVWRQAAHEGSPALARTRSDDVDAANQAAAAAAAEGDGEGAAGATAGAATAAALHSSSSGGGGGGGSGSGGGGGSGGGSAPLATVGKSLTCGLTTRRYADAFEPMQTREHMGQWYAQNELNAPRGRREACLFKAFDSLIVRAPTAPPGHGAPAPRNALARAWPGAAPICWPDDAKEAAAEHFTCPACGKKRVRTSSELIEHLVRCPGPPTSGYGAGANGGGAAAGGALGQRRRPSMVERQAIRLLALEHFVSNAFLKANWAGRRLRWREAVAAATREPARQAEVLASCLLQFEDACHPVIFNAAWEAGGATGRVAVPPLGHGLSARLTVAETPLDTTPHVPEASLLEAARRRPQIVTAGNGKKTEPLGQRREPPQEQRSRPAAEQLSSIAHIQQNPHGTRRHQQQSMLVHLSLAVGGGDGDGPVVGATVRAATVTPPPPDAPDAQTPTEIDRLKRGAREELARITDDDAPDAMVVMDGEATAANGVSPVPNGEATSDDNASAPDVAMEEEEPNGASETFVALANGTAEHSPMDDAHGDGMHGTASAADGAGDEDDGADAAASMEVDGAESAEANAPNEEEAEPELEPEAEAEADAEGESEASRSASRSASRPESRRASRSASRPESRSEAAAEAAAEDDDDDDDGDAEAEEEVDERLVKRQRQTEAARRARQAKAKAGRDAPPEGFAAPSRGRGRNGRGGGGRRGGRSRGGRASSARDSDDDDAAAGDDSPEPTPIPISQRREKRGGRTSEGGAEQPTTAKRKRAAGVSGGARPKTARRKRSNKTEAPASSAGRDAGSEPEYDEDEDEDGVGAQEEDEDEDEDEEEAAEDGERCEVCSSGKHEAAILICDGCDRCYHLFCLPRPLLEVPEGEWFCQVLLPHASPHRACRWSCPIPLGAHAPPLLLSSRPGVLRRRRRGRRPAVPRRRCGAMPRCPRPPHADGRHRRRQGGARPRALPGGSV